MHITIKSKNLEITDSLSEFIENKTSALQKFINILKEESDIGKDLAEIIIEIEKETKHHRKGEIFWAAGSVNFPGKNILVKEKGEDIKKAIVAMLDKFKIEIKQYKSKSKEAIRKSQKLANEILIED